MKRSGRIRISFNAPVILLFTFLCLLALVMGALTSGQSTRLFFSVYRSSLKSPLTYVRMIGHVFGHTSISHLYGNICMILVIGPLLEEKYGSRCLVEVILLTAVVTGVIHAIFLPHTALSGASGVVFAFIVLGSITNIRDGEVPLTFILVFVIFIGQQLFLGLTVTDNVSNLTHIIGGIVGALVGFGLSGWSREAKRGSSR